MVRYKAKLFRSKYKISSKSSLEYVKMVVHKSGYNLLTYTDGIMSLSALNLQNKAKNSPALTVIDDVGNIIVYYNEQLPINVQRFALAHELGHIVLGHFLRKTIGEKEEIEANKFAKYLLAPKSIKGVTILQINCLILSICICICILMLYRAFHKSPPSVTVSQAAPSSQSNDQTIDNTQLCYFTDSGVVYHLYKDCYHLKNSKTIHCDTVANSNKYRLCSDCEYRKLKE